ncbi:hypothetical protein L2E82_00936 [Cichorium intybus]|uniref:Uncharacterized protein n=1 Tax=Cichorium intybus TaxID=13427 RepID=A0ACB9GYU1_CICIN|nr:hypothetical protein L2E82_00936 [Cichorium intybus]
MPCYGYVDRCWTGYVFLEELLLVNWFRCSKIMLERKDGDDGCDNSADFFSFKVIFQIYHSLTVPTFRDNSSFLCYNYFKASNKARSEDLFGCGNNKMPFKFNNDESEEGLGVDESSSGTPDSTRSYMIPRMREYEIRQGFVYLLAGYNCYLSGLELVSYKAFYAMAVIGVVSFVFRIIERRNQRGGVPYYSNIKHSHRY